MPALLATLELRRRRQSVSEAAIQTLERHGVLYVVIGGAATQARGWAQPTEDIDVTPERSQENIQSLAVAVAELDAGFRHRPDSGWHQGL